MLKKELGYERGNPQLRNDIQWYIYENKSIYGKKGLENSNKNYTLTTRYSKNL